MADAGVDLKRHIAYLFTAELQFRLASAVRLATTLKCQPLDLPLDWVHGQHRVRYAQIALGLDQAEVAAVHLQRSSTFLMAVAMRDALRACEQDPKNSTNPNIRAAYQISRLIRNAFAHSPFAPIWCIDPDCRDAVFSVEKIISVDTTDIDGKPFHWKHYGGPLALLKLCRFVRITVLGDKPRRPRNVVGSPQRIIIQQGDVIVQEADEIPCNVISVELDHLGRIDLGGGYYIQTR